LPFLLIALNCLTSLNIRGKNILKKGLTRDAFGGILNKEGGKRYEVSKSKR
jgi:hypothetical protein